MIILPSVCSGSQIVLSHSSTTKAIASPPEPMTSMTILAWYNEVKAQIMPSDSGYRIALLYNIIQPSVPGFSIPMLPDTNAVKQFLGSILRKWDAGRYKTAPEGGFVVYPLQHKYDTSGLLKGGNVLKDADERRVALLEEVAGLQGFVVVLANLEHYVTGTTDTHTDPYEGYSYDNPYPHKRIRGSSGSYRGRSRFGSHCKHDSDIDSGDELDTLPVHDARIPDMDEVLERATRLSDIVDLEGKPMIGKGTEVLLKNQEALVLDEDFGTLKPDNHGVGGLVSPCLPSIFL